MKIVADRDIPCLKGVLEPYAEVVYLDGSAISAVDVKDASAIITRTRTRCEAALLGGSAVEMIATATIGYDHIDVDYCRSHGIEVSTSAGCNARAVLQWFAAAMRSLWLSGRIAGPGETTVGVVGVGNVGSLIEQYARLWGFRVLCCDPPRQRRGDGGQFTTLGEIARLADVISFHVPLTRAGEDSTYGMAGEEFFAMLKPCAVVMNSSRGEIVDGQALLSAVESGRCGCVIDTWPGEPDIDPALASAALLATPHIAGYSAEGKAMGTAMAVRALVRHFGWPLGDWYPAGAPFSQPRDISWNEMCGTMLAYFDIESLNAALKRDTAGFERMRNSYEYRREYF